MTNTRNKIGMNVKRNEIKIRDKFIWRDRRSFTEKIW